VNQKITRQVPLDFTDDSWRPVDLPCPVWVSMAVYFFRLGIGVFLILSLFLSGCSAHASEDFWQPATTVLTSEQIQVIIAEHSTFTIETVPSTWIDQARIHQAGVLLLIDFHQPGLCGRAGCLYVGYARNEATDSLNLVLYARLRTELPRDVMLFEAMEQSLNGLPCLTVHQIENRQLQAIALCFDGTEYVKQSSFVVTPGSQSQPQKSLNHQDKRQRKGQS
jgi:hypothetical protein